MHGAQVRLGVARLDLRAASLSTILVFATNAE